MKKLIFTMSAIAGLLAASCSGGNNTAKQAEQYQQEQAAKKQLITGVWLAHAGENVAGFELKEGGLAEPINAPGYPICAWSFSNDTLFLTTADGATAPWILKGVNADSLVISIDNVNVSVWTHK